MATDSTDPGIPEPRGTWHCWECDADVPDGEQCKSPGCIKIMEDMGNAYAEWKNEEWWELFWLAMKLMIRDRCKEEIGYYAPPIWGRLGRWWYTLKAYLCLLLNLQKFTDHKDQHVTVATLKQQNSGCGWDEDWIVVGYGVFTNWYYAFEHDGDSTY